MSLVKVATDAAKTFMKTVFQGIGAMTGTDTSSIGNAMDAQDEMIENFVGKDRGKDFMEREKDQRIQEQHTARMFSSTLQHTGDQIVEPAIFYANTVKFP